MPTTEHTARGLLIAGNTCSPWIGFVYVFNLIVGTGALTLPAVFAKAGWLLSLITIAMIACISYITVTFIIESMACMNAVRNWQYIQFGENDDDSQQSEVNNATRNEDNFDNNAYGDDSDTTDDYLLPQSVTNSRKQLSSTHSYYQLREKYELGEMASIFFSDSGRIMFYLCIAIYLYGDLSIYSSAIAKSLRDVICDKQNVSIGLNNSINAENIYDESLSKFAIKPHLYEVNDLNTTCWHNHELTRINIYRILLIGFTVIFGPIIAFSIQKTKYLQIVTTIFRWLAFVLMIALAIKSLIVNGVQGHPPAFDVYGLPALFGAGVYSFMCHHSLPSLVALIRDKNTFRTMLSWDYLIICVFYVLLSVTGIFAFAHLEDLYTLNFIPTSSTGDHMFRTELLMIMDYFLALFPVFTISASFPIIAITLQNNLKTLFLDMSQFEAYNFFVRRLLFPFAAMLPPVLITYFTENLTSLVSFTGTYAGAGIQYIIPVFLVYFARRTCHDLLGSGVINDYKSPFSHNAWLVLVLIWSVGCICLVTINMFY